MPTGERAKALTFRLWSEGKSLVEIQAQLSRESKSLQLSIEEWIIEWERGRQHTWIPKIEARRE